MGFRPIKVMCSLILPNCCPVELPCMAWDLNIDLHISHMGSAQPLLQGLAEYTVKDSAPPETHQMGSMGPTLTLSGPWAKPPCNTQGLWADARLTHQVLSSMVLHLTSQPIMIIHCPTREDLSLGCKEQCCTLYLYGSRELKPSCKHFRNHNIYFYISYKIYFAKQISTVEIGCRQSWFPLVRVHPRSLPLSDKGADPVTMITHSDEFSDCPNIPRF